MLKFKFKRSIFSVCESAFGSIKDCNQSDCDVVYMHSNDTTFSEIPKGSVAKKQATLLNDLLQNEEELLLKIKKNCKYEIRRAERENAICAFYDRETIQSGSNVIQNFCETYNNMFAVKGLSGYSFNMPLVSAGMKTGNVVITTCSDEQDARLCVYHAYLCDGESCVLMYSASPVWDSQEKEKINAIGRMNKLLHWNDMKEFKARGYSRYEWGGIADPDNPNGIDRFKMEFGGEVKQYYNYIVPRSLLGKLYVYLVNRRGK